MAQHYTAKVGDAAWIELTDADVTAITFENRGPAGVAIMVTAGAVSPTDFEGALIYGSETGEINRPLTDLAPGISGTRVFARSASGFVNIAVSHA